MHCPAKIEFFPRFSSYCAMPVAPSTNHVDSLGGRGVPQMSMFVHEGGGGSRVLSTWIIIIYYSTKKNPFVLTYP